MKHRKTGKLSIPFNEGIYLELIYYLILFEIEEKKGFSTVNLTMKLNLIASHFTSKSRIIRYSFKERHSCHNFLKKLLSN
jgi:hypothetical protein